MADTAKNETPQHRGYALLMDVISALPPSDARITLSLLVEHHEPILSDAGLLGGATWVCRGCDLGPWVEYSPDAPCSTLTKVAECLGVAL